MSRMHDNGYSLDCLTSMTVTTIETVVTVETNGMNMFKISVYQYMHRHTVTGSSVGTVTLSHPCAQFRTNFSDHGRRRSADSIPTTQSLEDSLNSHQERICPQSKCHKTEHGAEVNYARVLFNKNTQNILSKVPVR